ncbi:hypothetical protein K438DRAFT_2100406 [Mycena galopus ATCC 62051]|nr:hypothetical protein K438DRAFT_2100406 [Mycena galopus ATCC 62051]
MEPSLHQRRLCGACLVEWDNSRVQQFSQKVGRIGRRSDGAPEASPHLCQTHSLTMEGTHIRHVTALVGPPFFSARTASPSKKIDVQSQTVLLPPRARGYFGPKLATNNQRSIHSKYLLKGRDNESNKAMHDISALSAAHLLTKGEKNRGVPYLEEHASQLRTPRITVKVGDYGKITRGPRGLAFWRKNGTFVREGNIYTDDKS